MTSDVYNFGVVLLKLSTGRKPVDHTLPRGQQSLVTWATPRFSEDKVRQCVDQRIGGDYPPKVVAKVLIYLVAPDNVCFHLHILSVSTHYFSCYANDFKRPHCTYFKPFQD
ncbi:hypothetical protein HRI_000798700 [Hibiscus trionum]|uniref:Protein kinase domain-containing protein n=1 Tax=Hibiscus trionum TaxID=183268 RepID=A0A9W7H598_HIBTR|nr:hypothetical protein HRI_000798700 [Hibiscus trionum]